MFIRKLVGMCLVLAFLTLACGQALGQNRNRDRDRDRDRGGSQSKPEPFEAEGTVQGVMMGRIQMVTNANKPILVVMHPMARIHLLGTGSIDLLRTGMYVELVGDLDKLGVGKEKVSQLTIFTPNPNRLAGLYPEGVAAVKRTNKDGNNFGQGEGPARGGAAAPVGGDPGIAAEPTGKGGRRGRGRQAGGDDLGGPGGPDGAPGGARPPAVTVQLPAVCTVRGQVKAFHDNNLSVLAGRSTVRIELTDNPQVDVDVADYSMAAKGDRIKVKGRGFPSKGLVQAEMVQIDAVQPLTAAKKHTAKPSKTDKTSSKRAAQPKKGAPATELGEGKEAKEVNLDDNKKDSKKEVELPDK